MSLNKNAIDILSTDLEKGFFNILKDQKNYLLADKFTVCEQLDLEKIITEQDLILASRKMSNDYELQEAVRDSAVKQLYLIIDEKVKTGEFKINFKGSH